MPNRNWTFLRSHDVTDHHIFRLRHDLYRFEPSGQQRDFVVIDTVSWVNVVPVTAEGNVACDPAVSARHSRGNAGNPRRHDGPG